MNINSVKNFLSISLIVSITFLLTSCSNTPENLENIKQIEHKAKIKPDYTDIIIPPNIAPLNFNILETGKEYFVKIQSKSGEAIKIHSKKNSVQIPINKWKKLLVQNTGNDLIIDIFIKDQEGKWNKYTPIINKISRDEIDNYVVYRQMGPLFNLYVKMSIVQRNIQNFDCIPVLDNRLTKNNCINCHNFCQNKTDRWLFHMRGELGNVMMLVANGEIKKISTKTEYNSPVAYPAWHPSGELIAFSFNNLILFFHSADECRDVLDKHSGIILYEIASNMIKPIPGISDEENIEIWPAWSPDGNYLYFCSAPKLESFINPNREGQLDFDKIKYSLMRIKYNHLTKEWGKPEVIISSSKIGLSVTEPRVSYDNRFLLFTASSYSQFPPYIRDSDIYILNLLTRKWRKLDINSNEADSFHSWSSNSRWIVFASKREDGLFTKLYFSHIDSSGTASKPFLLPQEDPLFYDRYLEIFNVPEFTKEKIKVSANDLAETAKGSTITAKLEEKLVTEE